MYSTNSTTRLKRHFDRKWIVLFIIIILLASGAFWRLRIYKPSSEVITKAGNLPQGTQQSNSSSNTPPPPKQPVGNAGLVDGGAADTTGQTSATTNASQWVTSKSGAITVEQPIANAKFQNGDYLIGTAKVGAVSFRLSDTSNGQIATGTLQVTDGKFSGKLSFVPHSSDGELDVFSTNDQGVELNEIQIAVKFK